MAQANSTSTIPDASELFGQASRAFEAALKQGIKIQEESAKWMTDMMSDFGSPKKWQERTQAVMEEAVAAAQKNVDEAIRLMNQNAQTSIDLMQKAMEARQSESAADAQTTMREWWESLMGAMRTNTQAVLQANNRLVESWAGIARKMDGGMFGQMAERMADQAKRMGESAMRAGEEAAKTTEKAAEQVSGRQK